MKASPLVVILCGGFGTRLGSLTQDRPKPLMPVLGKPFLDYQVELLCAQGFERFLFLTGYKGEQIEARYAGRVSSIFSREETPLGTGGALAQAVLFLPELFFILNGDSYLGIDYQALLGAFLEAPASPVGMLAAYVNPDPSAAIEANNLALDGNRVFAYQKRGRDPQLTAVDAGAGIYRKSLLDHIRPDDPRPLSLEETVWPRVIEQGRLLAHPVSEPPFDIGTPERLALFERKLEAAS